MSKRSKIGGVNAAAWFAAQSFHSLPTRDDAQALAALDQAIARELAVISFALAMSGKAAS